MDSPIRIDPEVMGGTPCFAGTRVPVETLFDLLSHGRTVDYFLSQFPTVRRELVLAVLERAGKSVLREAIPAA